MQAFSGCGEWGLVSILGFGLLTAVAFLVAPGAWASGVAARGLGFRA